MIQRILAAAGFALLSWLPISAYAQSGAPTVLPGGCGTASYTHNPAYLTVDSTGKLCTNAASGGGGLSVTDQAAWTAGASQFTPGGGFYNSSQQTLTSGQQGTFALSSVRSLMVDTPTTNSSLYSAITAPAPVLAGTAPTTQAAVSTGTTTKLQSDLNGNLFIAPQQLASLTNPAPIQGTYFYNVASSVLTRASNTTQYAANETVCLLASVTTCAPITISIGLTNQGNGLINRVSLLKSGSTTTLASFTIWFFSAAPVVTTPNQFDATSYTGPRAADMPNYIGNAQCTSPTVTSDTTTQVWYDCSLSNPNGGGVLDFQALSGVKTIDALISVTAAYTPVSAETFTVYASGIY